MVEVLKLGEGKARVTKNDTTMHGIEYVITDDVRDMITFYVDNNSLGYFCRNNGQTRHDKRKRIS